MFITVVSILVAANFSCGDYVGDYAAISVHVLGDDIPKAKLTNQLLTFFVSRKEGGNNIITG